MGQLRAKVCGLAALVAGVSLCAVHGRVRLYVATQLTTLPPVPTSDTCQASVRAAVRTACARTVELDVALQFGDACTLHRWLLSGSGWWSGGWNRPSATMEQQLANMMAESRRTLQCRPILCRYVRTSPLPTTPAPATAQPQSAREAMGSSTCGVTSGTEQRGPLQW